MRYLPHSNLNLWVLDTQVEASLAIWSPGHFKEGQLADINGPGRDEMTNGRPDGRLAIVQVSKILHIMVLRMISLKTEI